MERTLYVTDMDGTLLGADSRVSDRSARIISELSRHGALITVATARTPATVEPLLAETYTALPAIVMTGASLWNRSERRYVSPCLIPPGVACDIEDMCRRHGVSPFVYMFGDDGILDVYYEGVMSAKERAFVEERMNLPLKRFIINERCCASRGHERVALYFAMGERERIFSLADALRENVDCSVSSYVDIFGADTGILEVFAPQVSKAAAVRALARDTGAGRVVVFGDNLNDLPMMAVADVAVAVDNALPEVKAKADVVIGRNTDDAVACYIQSEIMCHLTADRDTK